MREQPLLDYVSDQENMLLKLTGLEHFISLFDQLTDRLTRAYDNLEDRVNRLTLELTEEIEHRKQELSEKEKATSRLETLLHLLPAGVVLLDGKGVVQKCNAAAVDLLGEPLEGERWLDIIQRCFAPKRDDGHEVSMIDGRRVSIATRSIDQEPGQLILLTDLTETRELQSRLSRYERLSAMGRMVASLAHQIRTPLSTAMLYAGHLCHDQIDDGFRQKCADRLMSRLVHLEQQVRDMLIFAKGETPLAERVSIQELEESLRHAAEAPLSKAGAKVQWQNRAGEVEVLCNKEALVGACMNLVNNSVEASEGELVMTIKFDVLPDGKVAIQVADNGPGFDAGQKEKLKEAFYTTKSQGTGLGLAVVQAVVSAHKGLFEIGSYEGGVVASIVLPVID
ncbi:MAG: PAS domain-containing sensor histidine kinase [Gammaproteobacteria bacterium]|nr:MAG: PAS domain-containing sensor histidine kinase [Pseudomonadota bacterium]PIE38134.1 MAG: PAS domain-containing sensor histidine kinase [Gammaproteobacteria bacterium]